MYFNDIHILWYVIFLIIGLFIGQLIDLCNLRLSNHKQIFTKESLKEYKKEFKPNYILMISIAIIYIGLLYRYGLNEGFINNINLIKYLLLTPMLLSAFVIDYKLQIIPNRLNLTMFEVGLVSVFILGLYNYNIAKDMLLGMLIGGGIFLIITLVGGLIAGKEAMGFGDVKLMGALGLFFGMVNIIYVAIIAFLVGAVISLFLLASKIKKTSEYIPFGPFIVIGSFIVMFIPSTIILSSLLKIFTLGMI